MKKVRGSDGWESFLGCFIFIASLHDGSHFKGSDINESGQEKTVLHVFVCRYG